ncbi:MAG TPA: DUF2069 domain-containing protein [Steroidobacteraceae bacterium]
MTHPGHPPAAAGQTARRAVLVSIVLLAVSVTFAALRSGTAPGNLLLAAVLLVPLALPLPGILRGRRRTYAWATLCVTPYFIYGTTEAVANPAVRAAAGAILVTSLAFFVALVAYLRHTRPQAAPAQSP